MTDTDHHQVLLSRGDGDVAAALAPRVRAAAATGTDVLCALPVQQAGLLQETLDGDRATVEFVDPQDLYGHSEAQRIAAWHRYADRSRARGRDLLVVGELDLSGYDRRALREWARYEAAVSVEFAGSPVGFLCVYDVRRVLPEVVRQIERAHPMQLTPQGPVPSAAHVDPLEFATELCPDELAPPPHVLAERPVTRQALPSIRALIRDEGARHGLDKTALDDAVTAVDEAASNAALHGGGGRFRLWPEAGGLCCEVSNRQGRIEDVLAGYRRPDVANPGGRGLWIIRQLCPVVEIGGGTVRLRLGAATVEDGGDRLSVG